MVTLACGTGFACPRTVAAIFYLGVLPRLIFESNCVKPSSTKHDLCGTNTCRCHPHQRKHWVRNGIFTFENVSILLAYDIMKVGLVFWRWCLCNSYYVGLCSWVKSLMIIFHVWQTSLQNRVIHNLTKILQCDSYVFYTFSFPMNTVVTFWPGHNHPHNTAQVLGKLPVGQEVKSELTRMFDAGQTAISSLEALESEYLRDGRFAEMANRSMLPDRKFVERWGNEWWICV